MKDPEIIVINGKTLAEILEAHKHWLNRDCDGWQNMRAILCKADLRCIDFNGANLCGADFCDANLSGANFCGADLSGAVFWRADLSRINFSDANLRGADLYGAKLSRANLRGADLYGAKLSDANFCGAKLSKTNLSGVIYNEITSFFAMQCPEEGAYVGWKKASQYIIKLLITEDAKRSSATTRKCRASKAKVLEIQNLDGTKATVVLAHSNYNANFIYEIGKTVEVKDFDDNRWNECSTGIHHFITRQEAVNY